MMELPDILERHGIETAGLTIPEHQREGDKTIFLLRVRVEQTLSRWNELRGLVTETGYWPIVGWDRFKRPWWEEERTRDIVDEAHRLDVGVWFEQAGIAKAANEVRESCHPDRDFPPLELRIHQRSYPFSRPSLVPIALIPTENNWEALAYLRGPEDGQPPHVHVAVLQYWHDRWGAEVVGWDSANLELRVERPPATYEDAFRLAKEQYIYSPDLVDQHAGSVSVLAKRLVNSQVWWFWWD